jgi:hypothetical protein
VSASLDAEIQRQALAPAASRWETLATGWVPPVAAATLLVARVIQLYDPHLIVDDAFISFRYASNLARGLGLVYNPGEHGAAARSRCRSLRRL